MKQCCADVLRLQIVIQHNHQFLTQRRKREEEQKPFL